jgi:hypothetical protein
MMWRICLSLVVLAAGMDAETTTPTVEEIVDRLQRSDEAREAEVAEYTATRRYLLRNKRFGKDAEMVAKVQYRLGQGKTFTVISRDADGLPKRVFQKLIDGEMEAAKKEERASDISAANYDFKLLGTEHRNGRHCYVLELQPKRKHKLLIHGRAWVDSKDFQLVRLEGRSAANLSFWTGKPYIEQDFRKVGDFWLSSRNHSVTNARFIGETELMIEYKDYQVVPRNELASRRVD